MTASRRFDGLAAHFASAGAARDALEGLVNLEERVLLLREEIERNAIIASLPASAWQTGRRPASRGRCGDCPAPRRSWNRAVLEGEKTELPLLEPGVQAAFLGHRLAEREHVAVPNNGALRHDAGFGGGLCRPAAGAAFEDAPSSCRAQPFRNNRLGRGLAGCLGGFFFRAIWDIFRRVVNRHAARGFSAAQPTHWPGKGTGRSQLVRPLRPFRPEQTVAHRRQRRCLPAAYPRREPASR